MKDESKTIINILCLFFNNTLFLNIKEGRTSRRGNYRKYVVLSFVFRFVRLSLWRRSSLVGKSRNTEECWARSVSREIWLCSRQVQPISSLKPAAILSPLSSPVFICLLLRTVDNFRRFLYLYLDHQFVWRPEIPRGVCHLMRAQSELPNP